MSAQKPLDKLWKEYAPSYDTYLRNTDVHIEIRERIANDIRQYSTKPSSIIDICCGTGLFEEEFIDNTHHHITGVDSSKDMLDFAIAKPQLKSHTTFIESEATNLACGVEKIADEQYDHTVIINGLYAIDDDAKAREEMLRVTKSRGLLFFAGPTPKVDPDLYLTNITAEFKEKGIYKDLKKHIDLVNKCNYELFQSVKQLHFYHAQELCDLLSSDCTIETSHENFWYKTGHYVVARKK